MHLLLDKIESAKDKIPGQGPLEYFIHHNTIHHYEHLNFFDAVKKAAIEFNSNAFMTEEFYCHKYNLHVIKHSDLVNEIQDFIVRNDIKAPQDTLSELLLDNRNKSSIGQNQQKIDAIQNKYCVSKPYFFSQIIKDDLGIDIDFYIAPTIYRFFSAYFDYGAAYWLIETRSNGMWSNFCFLHQKASCIENAYRKNVANLTQKLHEKDAITVVQYILSELKIHPQHVKNYLFEVSAKHKGWAGFIKSLEEHPEWIKCHDIIPSFVDFIAIVLTCEYAAILALANTIPQAPRYKNLPLHSTKFLAHFFANTRKYYDLLPVISYLTDFNRQEILHRAYERSFYNKFLVAYADHDNCAFEQYQYQIVCCIDDREESFRRYLEMDSRCETFGCAGHFGLNILYKSCFDKYYRALCPINVKPEHKVTESIVHINPLKHKMLLLWGELQWLSSMSSKTLVFGYFQSFIVGLLSVVPFILDVIDPRITGKFKNKIQRYFKSSVITILHYKKESNVKSTVASDQTAEDAIGISFETRLTMAESFLTMIGLAQNFAPFVFILGHGSLSLNNPHKAAYDCGACGGGTGAPNARLIAAILNEPEIREALVARSIIIPSSTKFIGAYHNTCSGEIDFFDIAELEHQSTLQDCMTHIITASSFDSKERCRRFNDLQRKQDPHYYSECAQARSLDLRQPRAEYGHATNALCIIGPRAYSRKLFLDRRSFLVSYSPTQDVNAANLQKLLAAVIPVCSGINLEYYFSFIDNEIYGCGTKLPHNVNALIGVINGHMSDLRLGLPWQTVEIHQPVRLFVMIISQLKFVRQLLDQKNTFSLLVKNEWLNIAIHDIDSDKIYLYKNGGFEEYRSERIAPQYHLQDEEIPSIRQHIDFGRIA